MILTANRLVKNARAAHQHTTHELLLIIKNVQSALVDEAALAQQEPTRYMCAKTKTMQPSLERKKSSQSQFG